MTARAAAGRSRARIAVAVAPRAGARAGRAWLRCVVAPVALALAASAVAHAAGPEPIGRVVFARGDSLWMTDGRGKAPAVAIATLPGPASDVRLLRTDAAGTLVLADVGGRWYWAAVPAPGAVATLAALPCGPGTARPSPGGEHVLCAGADGHALIVRLADGKRFDRDVPAAGAAITERAQQRELVWVHDGAVVAGPLATAATPNATEPPRVVAPTAPSRGLVVSPDGRRAVGVYLAPAFGQPRSTEPRDQLFGFALDGTAARRRLIRDGVVVDWSADGAWLLVQDGGQACIARAVGGMYRCWKGFTAVSISPDGAWGLFLGPRDGADAVAPEAAPPPTEGEGADEGGDEPDEPAATLPAGALSLYRGKLAGNHPERPALVEKLVDGAAVWLPPLPAAAPAP